MKPNTIKDITDFIFLGKDFVELSHYDLLIINADWAEEQLAKDMKLMLDKNIIDNNTTFIICEGHGNTEKRSASILIDYLKKEGLTNKIIISDKYISNPEILRNIDKLVDITKYNRILRRSEEHTSELQSRGHLVCRLLLEKKKKIIYK